MKLFPNLTKRAGASKVASEEDEQAEQAAKMVPVLCKVLEALNQPFPTVSKEDIKLIVTRPEALAFVGHRATTKG